MIEGSSITMKSGVVKVCAGWLETAWTVEGLGEQRGRVIEGSSITMKSGVVRV